MKLIFDSILAFLVLAVFTYLGFVFFEWTFDVSHWSKFCRGIFGAMVFIELIFVISFFNPFQ